jgi:hypothetical protein
MLFDGGKPIDQLTPREVRKHEAEMIRQSRRQLKMETRFDKLRRRIHEWVNDSMNLR